MCHHSSKYLLSCRWPLNTNFFDETGDFHFEEKKNKRSVIEFLTLENEYLYVEKICDVVCSGLPQRLKSGIVRSKSLVFYLLNEVTRCPINHWFLREKTVGFRKKNNSEQTHLSFTFWFPSLPL